VVKDGKADYTVEVEYCVSPLKLRVTREVRLEWETDSEFQLGMLYNLARYTPCFFVEQLNRDNRAVKVELVLRSEPANSIVFYLPVELYPYLEDIYIYVEDVIYVAKRKAKGVRTRKKALVLIKEVDNEQKAVKLLFPVKRALPGRIEYVVYYTSRSGAHWDRSYDPVRKKYVRGPVIVLGEAFKLTPYPLSEYFKPTPRELKTIYGREVIEDLENTASGLAHNLELRNVMINSTHNGVVAYTYLPYDYKLLARKIANQANLLIYSVNKIPANILLSDKPVDRVTISQHEIIFEKPVQVVQAVPRETRFYEFKAVLAKVENVNKVTVRHPEHGTMTTDIYEPGVLFLHVRYLEGLE